MKVFSATYTDIIKFNRKPNEDFFLISKNLKERPIFVLADGVTQSRFEDGSYSYPAGAKAAAEIFCYIAMEYLEKNLKPSQEKKTIENGFDLANKKIWELNKNEGMIEKLDYVVLDYFDTVAVAGFLAKNTLFYGYVGDCGLAIFDKNNQLRFQTKDLVEPAVKRAKLIYKNWDELAQNERTKIFHRDFRNNPSGEGYGSFSGEPGVKKYYKIDSLILDSGDLVIFYSDGFVDYLKFPEFIKILRREDKKALDEFTFKMAKENEQKFGTDRTLISILIF
ncbi:protein phosphatase 2C domain-containing protein [Patescibacteria group bacterium]|nr:protein phosphatase 2C domain-containing protein [Patescibacteria group bacterium]MBU4481777.1 protein phosphatase 2C domain-containing protein [Patescibacteria group bacterium]